MDTRTPNDRLPSRHIPYLDGWRGLAIICVLLAHFMHLGHLGGFGVSVFFVLSGVLMSRILFIEQMPLRTFYRRRAARILPVFVLYTGVVFLGGWWFLGTFDGGELVATLLFLRTYVPSTPIFQSNVPIGHLWSLNVEEHCYVLLSLFSLLALRHGARVARWALTLGAGLCVLFFVYYKYRTPGGHALFTLRSEVAAFPLLLSCALYLWLQEYPVRVPAAVPVVSLALALLGALVSGSVFLSFVWVSVFLAIAVNTLAAAPAWFLGALSHPLLKWFGVCSFSIYLWQQVFYFLVPQAQDVPYYPVLAVAATLLVASASFYLFENPMRQWLSAKPRGRAALAPLPVAREGAAPQRQD